VADIDVKSLLAFHGSHGKLGTVTAVRPSSRYGEILIRDGLVDLFQEKPQVHEGWISGGFFVFNKRVLDLIEGDEDSLEYGLLCKLTAMKELAVHEHPGFWQSMDTHREMTLLNQLWDSGKAAWAVWK
jgi:glucose-1-phosphate cytidylyltransferase